MKKQWIVCILIGFCVGVGVAGFGRHSNDMSASAHVHEEKATIWTCSMHPQIQLPKPGKCPICAMDLIPLEHTNDDSGLPSERNIHLSEYAASLAQIQTRRVQRMFVTRDIELFGEVDYDETQIAYITAWASGRLDRLYIDEIGVPVRKGDHLAYLYSPELLSAQEEYLQAIEGDVRVQDTHLDIIRTSSKDTIRNAREKLRLLGVTEEQIAALEQRKQAKEHITIYSPTSGVVLTREVQEGAYVQTGQRLYSVADLSAVWIRLDAYESDVAWLRHGQEMEFNVEAYPGETFRGRISFISPIVDRTTRTIKVRVNVDNADGRLKPGMFVRAHVRSQIAEGGQIMDSYMANKWICPMHPSVIKDAAGACPVCDMPLVSTQELGYKPQELLQPPLVVPASAVLKTGKRAVVYVQDVAAAEPTFEGREIVVGARAGDHYIVKSGLAEGDMVVTNGNFKLDSALQIQARPSMMSAAEEGQENNIQETSIGTQAKDPMLSAFLPVLTDVYNVYFNFHAALAADDFDAAQSAVRTMTDALDKIPMNKVPQSVHMQWMTFVKQLHAGISVAQGNTTIDTLRTQGFKEISDVIVQIEKLFGHAGADTYYEAYCPMALDNTGSSWLQKTDIIDNPFFGSRMLRCGEITQVFTGDTSEGEHNDHA